MLICNLFDKAKPDSICNYSLEVAASKPILVVMYSIKAMKSLPHIVMNAFSQEKLSISTTVYLLA